MSTPRFALRKPSLFDFFDEKDRACRGADQEWFRDAWQRRAGCGPTTAATCLSYLARQNPALNALLPPGEPRAGDFVSYMEAVWQQVTPTDKGLHSLELYWRGALEFAALRGCRLTYEELAVPGKLHCERAAFAEVASFLQRALSEDRPVAFLNFSNGALTNLDSWHWVPLIWAEGNGAALSCGILDEGLEKVVDLALWYETSLRGGGFVSLGVVDET